ncbi:hypothetical protein [Streptomyces broussonetiae]|nr:hypothetical protein [Streptomyces broussonetiae]
MNAQRTMTRSRKLQVQDAPAKVLDASPRRSACCRWSCVRERR